MESLIVKAFGGLLFLLLAIGAALFLPVWSLNYWQAWVFLAVFAASVIAITLYLATKDRELLQRRVKAGPVAEKEIMQKVIQSLAGSAFIAIFIVSAFDHRFGWSAMAAPIVIAGDLLVALGLLGVFFVFKENTFTSATIEVAAEQKIITTGPYAIVRNPMYGGAFVMLIGVPLSLGSWWGLAAVVPIMIIIIWRLIDEEAFLEKHLQGYAEYEHNVRRRLIPFIF